MNAQRKTANFCGSSSYSRNLDFYERDWSENKKPEKQSQQPSQVIKRALVS